MKNFKLIFLGVFFLYHLVVVILVLTIDSSFKFVMDNMLPGALLGLLLVIVNLVLFLTITSRYKRRISRLEKEILEVKSRVYDREKREEEIDQEMEAFGRTLNKGEEPGQLGEGKTEY